MKLQNTLKTMTSFALLLTALVVQGCLGPEARATRLSESSVTTACSSKLTVSGGPIGSCRIDSDGGPIGIYRIDSDGGPIGRRVD